MAGIDENLLRTKFGFNDPNVIRGILSDPGQVARYEREAGLSGGSSGGGGGNVLETAKQLLGFQQQANQPAIQSLQTQVGEVGQSFAGQRQRLESGIQPLKDRYNQILDEMKGRVSTDVSREYGRRGIPLSSGMFEQDLTSKINPLTRDIGLAREEGIRGIQDLIASLTGQETESKRNIFNDIAKLQAGAPGESVSQALSMIGQQNQAAQSAADRALQERQFSQISLPESQANIRNIASLIGERTRTGAGDITSGLEGLYQQFSGGQTAQPASGLNQLKIDRTRGINLSDLLCWGGLTVGR